ncbi:MAG: hypothetical protein JW944_09915 [Deltaproteobacteria bacterium]|nr:hypothetical protein [Deltaproteobacteria bacterium]
MNIIRESMNTQFGWLTSALVLVMPPIISITVTLYLRCIIGPLGCIVIFPAVYVLSLFVSISGVTYLIRIFKDAGRHKKEDTQEERTRQLEQLVNKLTQENELLKKGIQRQ